MNAIKTLNEVVGDTARRPALIEDCVALLDAEVAERGGLTGFAIRAGYGVLKSVKPGFVNEVVNDLLPEFAAAVDPFFLEASGKGVAVDAHFVQSSGRIADALLAITDEKVKIASGPIKAAYGKLRAIAKRNVEQAMPRVGKLVEKHAH